MYRVFAVAVAAVLLFGSINSANAVQLGKRDAAVVTEHRYDPTELLVKFRAGVGVAQAQIASTHGAREVRPFVRSTRLRNARIDRWNLVKLNLGMDAKRALELFTRDPNVEHAELNYEVRIDAAPNDPRFGEQWGLHNTGQVTGSRADADTDALEAWDLTIGSDAIVVAVIDTGIDYAHPDLLANMWVNPGEVAGNGLDDDGNGYVDDIYGYDFYNNDNDPFDDNGHGTHVAGTIAAVGDNGIGVVGVNWRANVMALKFLGPTGTGPISGAINAVIYATNNGARVLNNSWGGGPYSQALRDAIATANAANGLFVAAAGNSTKDNDLSPHYPSSYDVPNVLAVAATDSADGIASFTNYGATTVDMGAPGVGILSTVPIAGDSCCSHSSGYTQLDGTSMASPHVAGGAALLLAQNPLRSVSELKNLLMASGDPVRSLRDITVSGNRLNVDRALRCVPGTLDIMATSPGANFLAYQNEPTKIGAIAHNCGAAVSDLKVVANFTTGDAQIDLYDDGLHGDGAAGDGMYAGTWTPAILGPVSISISALHGVLGFASDQMDGRAAKRVTYQFSATPYEWIDARAGVSYTLADEGYALLQPPFPFDFYGIPVTSILITSNGYLNFQTSFASGNNAPLPVSYFPYSIVAPLWVNLNPAAGGLVYSLPEGVAPNRRFTAAWVGVPYVGLINSNVSFEVTLYEGSNDIVFQYQDVDFGNSSHNFGASATIGVQDQSGKYFSQYSYRQPVLRQNTAIRFRPGDNNARPTARPGGSYSTFINTPLIFNGSGSDPENAPLTYRWDFGDGATGAGATPTHSYLSKGTFRPFLIVNDGVQDSAPVLTIVTILNRAPVANPGGPYNGFVGTPIVLNGTRSSDPDGDALTYQWTFGDGTIGTGATPTKTYNRRGTYLVGLTVSDGSATSTIVSTTATIPNRAPVANAGGPYAGTVNTPIVLRSTGSSDPDNDPLTYSWNFGDGTIGTGATPNKSYTSKGTFTVTLTVSDGLLSSAPATATVTIGNRAPSANAGGPYTGDVGVAVAFTGTATDADGDTLTYNWDFGDGATGTGANTSHVYIAKGSYTATLTVNDGTDDSAPATTTVSIRNRAPIANAGGPYTSYVGTALTLDGSASSDADSDTLTYRWDFGDGTTGTGVRPLHTYAARGSYTVTLIVNDGSVDSSAATSSVSVPNRNPAANAGGPYSGFIGVPVTLNGSSSDADGDALSYSWNFGDNTTGVGANPSHSYSAKGSYTVSLIVNDGSADSAPSAGTVTIGNRAPSANAGGPYNGGLTTAVALNGSASSDPDGDVLSYAWNFGDGGTSAGSNPTHQYTAPGTYTIGLIVNDGSESSTVASATVTIVNQTPTANAGIDRTIRKTTSNVYLDGRASADSDGTIASYRWRQVSGYAVTLYNATIARPYFRMSRNIRPLPQNLVFELTVTDNFGANASDTVTITVRN